MKVAYDNIIFSLQQNGGPSIYWMELCKYMQQQGIEISFFEHPNTNSARAQIDITTTIESKLSPKVLRALPFRHTLPAGTIFHSSYYRYHPKKDVKTIVTVHDFIPEFHGKGYRVLLHKLMKNSALNHASGIICQSENTKKDLLSFRPDLADVPIQAIYLGVDNTTYRKDPTIMRPDIAPEDPFVLYIGSRAPYKNFDLAVLGTAKTDYHLVIASGGDLRKDEKKLLDQHLPGRYTKLPFVSNADLNALYNHAHAFLYPSSYEGFGIPVAEALLAGCPVIATNSSSLPEASGGHAYLMDEPAASEIAEGISRLESETYRDALTVPGIQYAQQFSWEQTGQNTLELYRRIADL